MSSCYEAGWDGFWIHRYLTSLGVENLVVDSSSIEVNRRARRAKTDRMDVEKLLAMLLRYVGGEQTVWRIVRVPSEVDEHRRQLHRELLTILAASNLSQSGLGTLAGYVDDMWRLTGRLTLSLGLRVDRYQPNLAAPSTAGWDWPVAISPAHAVFMTLVLLLFFMAGLH